MNVCIDGNQGFVSLVWYFYSDSCSLRGLVDHLFKLGEANVLLRSLQTSVALMPLNDCEALKD